jgi:hypothetical protein
VHGASGSVSRPIGKSPANLAKEKRSSKAIQKQAASKSRQAPGAMHRLVTRQAEDTTETSMRLPDWKTCAGYLAVIAVLALSLPGVRAVRADEEVAVISVNLVDSEPICDPGSESGVTRSAQVFLGSDSDPSDGRDPIVLNTQGYSYRPLGVDPEARRLEQH